MTDSQITAGRGLDRAFIEDFTRRWVDAWNSHDSAQLLALTAPDVVYTHSGWPTTMRSHDDVRAFQACCWRAAPDLRIEVIAGPFLLPDQAKIAIYWRASGTHTGMWDPPGLAATGRPFAFTGAEFQEIRDGKTVAGGGVFDVTDLLRQMEVFPAQGSRAERRMMRMLNVQTKLKAKLRRRR
jgi:steroid delta-isomerase-like uncharacterized protein